MTGSFEFQLDDPGGRQRSQRHEGAEAIKGQWTYLK